MAKYLKYCPYCDGKNLARLKESTREFGDGYMNFILNPYNEGDPCPTCHQQTVEETNITLEEFNIIGKASHHNRKLLDAMRKLKDEDVIEYELKMSQFRKNISDDNQVQSKPPQPRVEPSIVCPKCGSSAISTTARGANGFWGFIGASKTVNRCSRCGHTWSPKG